MSFVDLATLTLHRRHEMEDRISTFAGKCDVAINNMRKLKAQARTFVNQLNCEPPELKERFLSCMNRLDEYIYLVTDFNLCIDKLEKNDNIEATPVQDNSYKNYPVMTPTNLMDVLSEPGPTPSPACANMCPEKSVRRRPRSEQLLIAFSSSSCSAESVPGNPVEKEVQCVTEELGDMTLKEPKVTASLPRQPLLDADRAYEAALVAVAGHTFWVVVDQAFLSNLLDEMSEYYTQEKNRVTVPLEELSDWTCCVYHDAEDTDKYFRAMFLKSEGSTPPRVFLVDTGEVRHVTTVQRIHPRFCERPPAAHSCHLADVEIVTTKEKELEEFLKEFVGESYTMKIDDNVSESLGVYLFLDGETTLNDLVLQKGLGVALDKRPPERPARASSAHVHVERGAPEHDDALEAVTGYSNRDEFDICKHYKGGSEKNCFKGARCKKRHVLKHPDGWTLDRVSTPQCPPAVLPAPGTWHKVIVTLVPHFDRLYVQFHNDVTEELSGFGRVLPPMSLAALVRDMNSPATYAAFKPLKIAPAPGELVAAQYRDGLWYRARVTCATRADRNVQVMFIDYGNMMSVKENEIMELEARFTMLPVQAVQCRLAGISAPADCSESWAAATRRLAALALDRTMKALVVARDYDELTVEVFDEEGRNLGERLAAAAGGAVLYARDYDVQLDARARCRLVQA